jgi:hypothetical protein
MIAASNIKEWIVKLTIAVIKRMSIAAAVSISSREGVFILL